MKMLIFDNLLQLNYFGSWVELIDWLIDLRLIESEYSDGSSDFKVKFADVVSWLW